MAEITCKVYDIFHPTPVSLKQLSAIAVSLGIWRCKMNYHRTNDGLPDFRPKIERNSLKTIIPNLASAIYEMIYEYVVIFGVSLDSWLHYSNAFFFHDRAVNEILGDFDDFVCDHNGTIDCVRTAECMIRCSVMREPERFRIACVYFFEDHIKRIWPNVSRMIKFDANTDCFDGYPHWYYWICYLKNELNKISVPQYFSSIDEFMLDLCLPNNRPSLEYFWVRIPSERQLLRAFELFDSNVHSFVRFVLQKLNDQQLDEFVDKRGCELMIVLSRSHYHDEGLFLPTWKYIKSRMSDGNLTNLVSKMLSHETGSFKKNSNSERKYWSSFCSEIWHSIKPDLKPSIVENVLSRSELFKIRRMGRLYLMQPSPYLHSLRCVEFLLTILSCATFEQRSAFWRKCWGHLIKGARVEDLQQIVKSCFENEEEIAEFKKNTMANSQPVRDCCVTLLMKAQFDELNDLVDFCDPDTETARIFKQEILRSSFLDHGRVTPDIIGNAKQFRVFVDSVFNNADLSADFKNQLVSSPKYQKRLSIYIFSPSVPYDALMEFFDVFSVTEQNLVDMKNRVERFSLFFEF